jgi:hypothetical protein
MTVIDAQVAGRVAGLVAAQVAGQVKARAVKSIASLVTGYTDDVTRDFQDVLSGDLLVGEARRRHRTYIKDNAEAVYTEGLAEGGAKDAELTDEDNAAIQEWIDAQLGYVAGLWDDVAKLSKDYEDAMISRAAYEAGRRTLYERIGTWGNSLRDLGNVAKASAMKDQLVFWRMGDTSDHCSTCAKLDGKKHRLSWFVSRGYIPQEVGSQELQCGGYRCLCILETPGGEQVLP